MNWRNLPEADYFLLARSYHSAAKKLAQIFELDPTQIPECTPSPTLSMYRRAVELHLKVIILGEGGNFLDTRPDVLAVHKTNSVSWLAQFISQIVLSLKWKNEFKAAGIDSLADFKVLIEEVNGIDPPFHAFRCPASPDGSDVATATVLNFARRLDALIELLERTADALAAEWDLRSGTVAIKQTKPTVH